ncbi:hypothetical protein [Streptomyces sp. 184]|uniref:hypothetical protein n=1 Tax=Streptomyces sp. 184 TaxID=1827526 RepID=UPI0038914BF1
MNTIAVIGWILTAFGVLLLILLLPTGFVPLLIFPMVYGGYRALIAAAFIFAYVRIRRILRAYPWRLDNAPYSLSQHPESPHKQQWIEFPNPERPEERIPLHFLAHFRMGWWQKRMAPRAKPELKAQLDPIWFAGDPRFFGVIAVSRRRDSAKELKPARLHLLRQSPAHRPWHASAKDVARAQQAGGKGMVAR